MRQVRGVWIALALALAGAACGPTVTPDQADAASVFADGSDAATAGVTPVLGPASAATVVTAESGGVLTFSGSSGTTVTLAIPAHALAFDTTVTCHEVTALTGAPLTAWLGGAQCAPNGLSLALPATLTVQTAGALPADALVGVVVQDDGTDLRLMVAKRLDARTAAVALSHFTGWGVGTPPPGQQPSPAGQVWAQASAENALGALQAIAQQTGNPASLQSLAQILQGWFDADLAPRLVAQNAADAEATFAEAVAWQLDVHQNGVDGLLAATMATEQAELAAFLAAMVQSALNKCNAGNDFQQAQLAVQWYGRVQAQGLESASGIDLATFRSNFCVHAQITSGGFGPMLSDGTSGSFDAAFTYTIGTAAPATDRAFRVRASTIGGLVSPVTLDTGTTPSYHADTSPMPAGSDMTVAIEACVLPFDGLACASQSYKDTHTAPCGHVGVTCCGGGACDGGLSCQAGKCQPLCGHAGAACCSGNSCDNGLACQSGSCLAPCGDANQPCCSGGSCNAGNACSGGTVCTPCGGASQPCCPISPTCSGGLVCGTGSVCGPSPCNPNDPLKCTLGDKQCVGIPYMGAGSYNAWRECVLNDVGCPQWTSSGPALHMCTVVPSVTKNFCDPTGGAHCVCECDQLGTTKCYDQGEGFSTCALDQNNGVVAECHYWQGTACGPGQEVVGCDSCACKPTPPACAGLSAGFNGLVCYNNGLWSCEVAFNGCNIAAIDDGACPSNQHCDAAAANCVPN